MSTHDEQPESRLDVATGARLAKLRSMPVDTSGLERSVRAAIPELNQARPESLRIGRWLRSVRGVAASLMLLGAIVAAILISTSGGEALASPAQMAQLHDDLVSGKAHVQQVDSIESANKFLAAQWSGPAPAVPDLPKEHVMACCMKSISDKRVACVLLKGHGGEPLTLSVAKAADMRLPKNGQTLERDGITYHAQSSEAGQSGAVNMVMFERNGRWVCLMGRTPVEQLVGVAGELKF
jgi:hypothetical protein